MKTLWCLIDRNIKLFFKDKGMFFTSLITPLILLLLYTTFLGNVYRDAFLMQLPPEMVVEESLLSGLVGGQLIASLLAVSCVTVSFCSNMLMVQDKVSGAKKDFDMTPVSGSVRAVSYYVSSFICTFLIAMVALAAGFIYLGAIGWYLSAADVALLILDVFLLVMFGTALSSVINFFLSSQGHISAVGTIVSSCYGFVCGAYMPLSQLGEGLRKLISFLPGTYGIALIKNHALRGAFREFEALGLSSQLVEEMKDGVDCNLYFFGEKVEVSMMYLIMLFTVLLLLGVYIALHRYAGKSKKV